MTELLRATRRPLGRLRWLHTHRGIERQNQRRHPVLQEESEQRGSAGALGRQPTDGRDVRAPRRSQRDDARGTHGAR